MLNNNNIYKYLESSIDKTVRSVLVITDKQSVFYIQNEFDDITHDKMYIKIENSIHPNDIKEGWSAIRNNNIHIASVGHEFIIYLPEDRTLSMNQYTFLCNMIDEAERFNIDKNKKILLCALYYSNMQEKIKTRNPKEMRDKLYSLVTKEIHIEEEKIIGDILDNNTIIKNMTYQIDINNSKYLSDVKVSMIRSNMYYKDSYYKDYLINIFPDFKDTYSLMSKFSYEDLFDIEIDDVDFSNIKEKIKSINNRYRR